MNDSWDEALANPVVACYKLQIMAVIYVLLFIGCLVFNAFLLLVFIRHKKLQNSFNMFIIALTLLNFFGSLLEFPFIILSNFYCQWIFGRNGCIFSGFVMYFIGASSIYLLVAISFERYHVITNTSASKFQRVDKRVVVFSILGCVLLAFVWAGLPLLGWSAYSLEGTRTSCSVVWNERSFNVLSYNISMFIGLYFLPLILIMTTNLKLIWMVVSLQKMLKKSLVTLNQQKRTFYEIKATITMILIIVGFFMSWTPYAMVTMWTSFVNEHTIGPLVASIPAMFAKSSMLWSSLLYIFSNQQIKKQFSIDLLSVIKFNEDSLPRRTDQNIYRKRKQQRPLKRANAVC